MTLFPWSPARLRKSTLGLDRTDGSSQKSHPGSRVPTEYVPLYEYLEHRYAAHVVLTFDQMESLLGFALPVAATTDLSWWTGDVAADPHTQTWRLTGRLARPRLLARIVAFERQS